VVTWMYRIETTGVNLDALEQQDPAKQDAAKAA
jgi:hypothetical protein